MSDAERGIVPRAEQETVVQFEYQDKTVFIYSSKPSFIKKMRKWLAEHPKEVKKGHEDKYGLEIYVPDSWVKIRPATKRSEDWKEAAKERLRLARERIGKEKPCE